MKTAAVIVSINRNGSPLKIAATAQIGTITAIERMIVTLKKAGVSDVYVTTNNGELKKEVAKLGVTILVEQAKDMLDYIKHTLDYIEDDYEQVIIIPDSTALFTSSTIEMLMKSGKQVAVPTYDGVSGHPIKVGSGFYSTILDYNEDGGLREALRQSTTPIDRVIVKDRGVLVKNIDDDYYTNALDFHDLKELRPEIKVRINREKPFFGPGTKQLMLAAQRTQSLHLACEQSGISYSKGRGMLRTLEEQLGYAVLRRQQGGELGGSSKLTEDGKAFLERYIEYEKLVKAFAEEQFDCFFEKK